MRNACNNFAVKREMLKNIGKQDQNIMIWHMAITYMYHYKNYSNNYNIH